MQSKGQLTYEAPTLQPLEFRIIIRVRITALTLRNKVFNYNLCIVISKQTFMNKHVLQRKASSHLYTH